MILLGDIGNSETKICLINSQNKITKRINFSTKNISHFYLKKLFNKKRYNKINIKKCLFCSVVPKSYKIIKTFFSHKYKIKCHELKILPLNKLIKI